MFIILISILYCKATWQRPGIRNWRPLGGQLLSAFMKVVVYLILYEVYSKSCLL